MEPIPQTYEAIEEFGPFTDEGRDLLCRLAAHAEEVEHRIPSLVGLSLTLVEHGVTFTLTATNREIGVLDAMQYLDGGPCVTAIEESRVIAFEPDAAIRADERWQLFSRASAAAGVASTLSLPLVHDEEILGGFNLYAGEVGAFDGRHEELAEVLGAWSGGAVVDGDLAFRSREVAMRAPKILREATRILVAQALVVKLRGVSEQDAEARLRQAAVRGDVPLGTVVDTVIDVLGAA